MVQVDKIQALYSERRYAIHTGCEVPMLNATHPQTTPHFQPPSSWERYRCHIICNDSISTECFNERLIKDTADAMVELGYKDAGYNYVAMDDCWQAPQRVNG